jgi:hypothetical protein
MKLKVPQNLGNFLSSAASNEFSRKIPWNLFVG